MSPQRSENHSDFKARGEVLWILRRATSFEWQGWNHAYILSALSCSLLAGLGWRWLESCHGLSFSRADPSAAIFSSEQTWRQENNCMGSQDLWQGTLLRLLMFDLSGPGDGSLLVPPSEGARLGSQFSHQSSNFQHRFDMVRPCRLRPKGSSAVAQVDKSDINCGQFAVARR